MQDADNISVVTFNVRQAPAKDGPNQWPLRKDLLLDVVRELDADILGTQEPFEEQVDAIASVLPHHRLIGVGRVDGVRAGEWSALFVRKSRFDVVDEGSFWLSETPDVPGSKGWDAPHHTRICTWARLTDSATGRELLVYNSHWDNDGKVARQQSAALIAARLEARPQGVPAIVMGDFNSTPDSPALRYLTGRGELDLPVDTYPPTPRLIDAWEAVEHTGAAQEGTFHGFNGNTDGPRIDYLLLTAGIRARDCEVIRTSRGGRFPSDHFPLRAVIEWDPIR